MNNSQKVTKSKEKPKKDKVGIYPELEESIMEGLHSVESKEDLKPTRKASKHYPLRKIQKVKGKNSDTSSQRNSAADMLLYAQKRSIGQTLHRLHQLKLNTGYGDEALTKKLQFALQILKTKSPNKKTVELHLKQKPKTAKGSNYRKQKTDIERKRKAEPRRGSVRLMTRNSVKSASSRKRPVISQEPKKGKINAFFPNLEEQQDSTVNYISKKESTLIYKKNNFNAYLAQRPPEHRIIKRNSFNVQKMIRMAKKKLLNE